MSIFSLLSHQDIKQVYDICDNFIDVFDLNEDVIGKIEDLAPDSELEERDIASSSDSQSINAKIHQNFHADSSLSKNKRGKAPKQFDNSGGIIGEEIKDDGRGEYNMF
jgi:hypothetical protein